MKLLERSSFTIAVELRSTANILEEKYEMKNIASLLREAANKLS
jgi:hypothetical protein